jgi:hypothetical protein
MRERKKTAQVAGGHSMGGPRAFDSTLLQHVSPLGWEHTNLTGDYTWHTSKRVAKGGYRPLRPPSTAFSRL